MSRVNEILEQIMLEDADAVLYSVMLSFLERKKDELDINEEREALLITIDSKTKTIDVYKKDAYNTDEIELIEEVTP